MMWDGSETALEIGATSKAINRIHTVFTAIHIDNTINKRFDYKPMRWYNKWKFPVTHIIDFREYQKEISFENFYPKNTWGMVPYGTTVKFYFKTQEDFALFKMVCL